MAKTRWMVVAAGVWLGVASFSARAASGTNYNIRNWGAEDLPQSSVIALTQTRDGYLWLGTLNGLVRFDGVRFTTFDENNTPGLGSAGIVRLFEDSRTNLWIINENSGITLIQSGRVTNGPASPASHEHGLTAACEDATGAVWLLAPDGRLTRHPRGEVDGPNAGLNFITNCLTVMARKTGAVWVGTANGLFKLDPAACEKQADPPREQMISETRVDFLVPGRGDSFWCLAGGYIQKWDSRGFAGAVWPYPGNQPKKSVTAACEDRDGNLVVGTLDDGVYRFDAQGNASHIAGRPELANLILSLTVDREGCLWVGTDAGGLDRIVPSQFDVWPGTEGKTIQSITEDTNGNVQPIEATPVLTARFRDRQGREWFSEKGVLAYGVPTGLKTYTARDGLPGAVRAIADDAEGNMWIGTEGGGLSCLRDGKFTGMHLPEDSSHETISALLMDGDGVLWIGTMGRGLERLQHGKWTRYTTEEGLAGNSISYLLEDGQGCLWLGSYTGLMRVQKQSLNDFATGHTNYIAVRVYGKSDGLPTRECTFGSQPAAARLHDGRLVFPTTQGLAVTDPARLVPNTNPPLVMIEAVFVDDRDQNTNGPLAQSPRSVVIPAGRERLDIQYTSLNLASPEQTRFRYRLMENSRDTTWTEFNRSQVGDAPTAHYGRLAPGDYHFQVTACNEDGVWNEGGASLAITVLPPFWRKWWFLTATGLGLFALVAGVVHYVSTQKLQRQLEGLRQQQALDRERARIARDIHDQLGASLTRVSLLGEMVESDKDSPGDVETHARQISQTARETTRELDEIVWTVNPSNDTLDGLVTYLCKYAQDYLGVAGVRFRIEVPDQLPEAVISPEVRHNVFLAAKEAVTNVVRHARAPAAWIRLRLSPGVFILEIQDNGQGIADLEKAKASSRNGLRNMRKRMEDVGGVFEINPAPEGGTLIRLTVPFKPRQT